MKLYATTIENLKAPETGRIDISDDKTTGLKLRVSASGHKSWSMTFKDTNGRAQRYGIGEYPGVTLEIARARATAARKLIQQGINPIEKERREKIDREEGMYPKCVAAYLEHLSRKAKPDYVKNVKKLLNITEWQDRNIREIRRRDAIAVYEKTGQRAPVQAVHQRIYFSALWKYCLQREIVDVNIITGTEPYQKPNPRTRVLDDLELASVWRCSYRLSQPFGACIRALMLTGLRKSNAANLQDAEISRDWQWFQFDASTMKGGRLFTLPISTGMRALLDAQPRHQNCAFYFTADGRRPVRGFDEKLQKLRLLVAEDMGHAVPHFHLHDIRRSVATGLIRLGVRVEVVKRILDHQPLPADVTMTNYVHHAFKDEAKAALELWSAHLAGLNAPKLLPAPTGSLEVAA